MGNYDLVIFFLCVLSVLYWFVVVGFFHEPPKY